MQSRGPLTDLAIRSAKPPAKGFTTLWDGTLKGFGCMVSQGGTKSFCVLVGSGRRKVIGKVGLMSLADARKTARTMLAEKILRKTVPTRHAFDDAKDEYLEQCERKNRPSTVQSYRRHLAAHYPFRRQNVADISPRQIIQKLNAIEGESEKHHAHVTGAVFFRWCIRQHLIDRSPMEVMRVPRNGTARERVLTDDELQAVHTTARTGKTPFHAIVALLVLTGQRRGEIGALQWEWVNGDTVTLPASITKNGREHTFPIGREAQHVLTRISKLDECPYVFPAMRQRKPTTTVFAGWGKPKARFDKECGVTDWTLHDLRRTFSSNMAALGVPQIVVEKLLNHVSGGTQSPIAQTYNRYSYFTEMKEAILNYEAFITTLLKPKG